MEIFDFLAVLIGCFNTFLLAVLIYVVKQPDPNHGKEFAEFEMVKSKIDDLWKNMGKIEKRLEGVVIESKRENIAKIETISRDVARQLQNIQDSL
jgi:hypothetical protein